MVEELKSMVGRNEKIFYEGKPKKSCYIFESIFNPMLPFALIWLIFDGTLISSMFMGPNLNSPISFLIPFFLLHLMPVWIYLFGIIFTFRKYRNAYYIVTDKAVYISKGIFSMDLKVKTFAEMSYVNMHRGILDQLFKVGDIKITTNQSTDNGTSLVLSIDSISNYLKVYKLIKELQEDIYSDIMYPNDLRPDNNPGYRTRYRENKEEEK